MKKSLYTNRKLASGYPGLERLGVEYFSQLQGSQPYTKAIIQCIEKIIDLEQALRSVLVVGCGPNPHSIREVLSLGFDAVGVEPIEAYVRCANEFLDARDCVRLGSAEAMPFENNSMQVILMESILEHVDSPQKSLAEAYRILIPGGVLYVSTTNRWKFSLTGHNGEFRTKFYNWFPDIVKESYVFQHLHYEPSLSNYTPRPAVHWFTYPELCKLGRNAGFAQFYSWLDLADIDSPLVVKSGLRRFLLNKVRYTPWIRSLVLTQAGGTIFMLKRTS